MKLLLVLALCALATRQAEPEKHMFQAEVSRLLDILINSLYSQKDIFIREAISNASDALDKIRFLGVKEHHQLDVEPDLAIRIKIDKENEQLIIEDTGIGMTKSDLVNNLGTIARSGTTQFLEAIAQNKGLNLIGQFGVGFYSFYLVASEVTVITKNNDDDQWIWKSSAGASFTIEKDTDGPFLKRGTKIILQLKKDAAEFLEITKIKDLIKRYSEFINFPIYILTSKEVEKEVEEEVAEKTETKPDEEEKQDDMEIKDEDASKSDSDKEPKKKKVKETVLDWEQLNESKAIWLRPIEEIEDEEYIKFYKTISKDYQDPLTWIHFRGEGEIDFTALLYIPKTQGFDWMDPEKDLEGKSNIKLYVRRVLISDDFKDLMPRWLRFVKGVVDSDDLPLNVSRESLQQLRSLKTIKKRLIKKVLEKLEKLAKQKIEDEETENLDELSEEERKERQDRLANKRTEAKQKYESFWTEFGKFIKLGIIDDSNHREKLQELVVFKSTFNDTNSLVSFEEYIGRMQTDQKDIYYIGGDNAKLMLENPIVRAMQKKKFEVLLLDQPIDEYTTTHISKVREHNLVNIGKEGFELPTSDDEKTIKRKLLKHYDPLINWLKKILPNSPKVSINMNLSGQPFVVMASGSGYSAHMTKIAKAQAVTQNDERLGMFSNDKKAVEINPSHPFIKELLEKVKAGADSDTEESAVLLYEVAMMNSGFELSEPVKFSSKVYKVLSDSLGLSRDLEETEIDVSNIEEQTEKPESQDNKDDSADLIKDIGQPVESDDEELSKGETKEEAKSAEEELIGDEL